MTQNLTRKVLQKILQAENITDLSYHDLARLTREEPGMAAYIPDGVCQIDPRNGERILFNSARARRPHDNRPTEEAPADMQRAETCVVCAGQTTGVVDVADLSQGFTFVNKNLYPVLYPQENPAPQTRFVPGEPAPGPQGLPSHGLHLLQWTSSYHERDWHNMPQADRVIVLQRLAALEKRLLTTSAQAMPATIDRDGQTGYHGYVEIIKNGGALVGGSLAHGHQQIGFSNVIPRRTLDNWHFEQQRGEKFSAYLQRVNPGELVVRDYGTARLVVPYFMRRPYDMLLLLKDVSKSYLHELYDAELAAVADCWHEAMRAFWRILPAMGREIAYNIITHNGPGAGLYFEFLPYTQEIGGFEHLGLFVCQGDPHQVAGHLREVIGEIAAENY
jgi:galactose-1-phosphate uridylyltransferase